METTWSWCKPELNRAGQTEFWNNQATSYEKAKMTNDNSHEIMIAIDQIKKGNYDEIVTLGGAVGCRDPKMILKEVFCNSNDSDCFPSSHRPTVFFNDLSPNQVDRAKRSILSRCYTNCGVKMEFHPGAISAVYKKILPRPRTLLMGIYSSNGFFHKDTDNGYPLSGFDEYIENKVILGKKFWFDWLILKDNKLKVQSSGLNLEINGNSREIESFKRKIFDRFETLTQDYGNVIEPLDVVALQVVSSNGNSGGYFLSHWYLSQKIDKLLNVVFPKENFEIEKIFFPKGMLLSIKRPNVTQKGVVTILNNVLGNIIPREQMTVLKALRSII